jgi:hypothetical protein
VSYFRAARALNSKTKDIVASEPEPYTLKWSIFGVGQPWAAVIRSSPRLNAVRVRTLSAIFLGGKVQFSGGSGRIVVILGSTGPQ